MKTTILEGAFGRIACHESDGTGPAVFIVHGNSASARAFSKQLDGPLGRRYRLIAIDLPGHGQSADLGAATPYGIKRYVEVVTAIARVLRVTDAVFVGWSLGGHVVLQAAPDLPKAAGLIILGTPPVGGPADFTAAFRPHPTMDFIFSNILSEAQIHDYAASGFRAGFDGIPSSVFDDIRRTDGRARAELRGSGFRNEREIVAKLPMPFAIFHGAQEQLIDGGYFKSLTAPTLWRGKVQIIEEAGHTPQWEQPERFDALLAAFLEDTQ